MMKKILAALIIPLMSGCSSDDNCCPIIEATMLFSVENSEGLDLLNPNSEAIDINLIKIFYTNENNELVEVNKPQLDASKGYVVIVPEMNYPYSIKVFLNTEYIKDNVSYTHIEWSSHSMDEIKTEFDLSNNNIIAKKIWVNNQLKWESSNDKLPITLIK